MRSLKQDLAYALRAILRRPGVPFAVVTLIAFGIAANSTVFSIVDSILFHPRGYLNADRLVSLTQNFGKSAVRDVDFSIFELRDLRSESQTIEEIAAIWSGNGNLSGSDHPERIEFAAVSGNYFRVLGAKPLLGRVFTPAEERSGLAPLAVISYGLWRRHFGGDAAVVGKTLRIDGDVFAIIGVMPADFHHPTYGGHGDIDVWAPTAFQPPDFAFMLRGDRPLAGIALLKSGRSLAALEAELGTIQAHWQAHYPEYYGPEFRWSVSARTVHERIAGPVGIQLWTLLGAVVFVLLIVCANVANLLVSRAAAREGEMAVRAALGASRARILRQMLVESSLLTFVGTVAGLLLAWQSLDLIRAVAGAQFPRMFSIHMYPAAMFYTLAIAVCSALLSGIALALHAVAKSGARDIEQALRRTRHRSGTSNHATRSILIGGQFAIAMILLVGAGLLLRSFQRMQAVNPGFRTDNLLTARLSLPRPSDDSRRPYFKRERRQVFYRELIRRVRALPGVESAGITTRLPFRADRSPTLVHIEGRERVEAFAELQNVSPDYFRTMGMTLIAGRLFNDLDEQYTAQVVVVSQHMQRKYWPAGADIIGRRIKVGPVDSPQPWLTVVGVAADVLTHGLDGEADAEVYFPAYFPQFSAALVLKSQGDPKTLTASLRDILRSIDKDTALFDIRTMSQIVDEAAEGRRFLVLLTVFFGGLALVLACIGLYGLVSYGVRQRSREIGLRLALGSSPSGVVGLILRQNLGLAARGVAAGYAASLVLSRFVAALLFGVTSGDILTSSSAAGILLGVALVASYIPARNAMHVDPIITLRAE